MTAALPLRFSGSDGAWRIDGELERTNCAELYRWCLALAPVPGTLALELADLEIVDNAGATTAVDAIRLLLQRCAQLELLHAPHTLAHTLYRIGMLESGSRLHLIELREEEAYG